MGEDLLGDLTSGQAEGVPAQPPLLGLFQELAPLDICGTQAGQEDHVRAAHKTVAALIADLSSGSPASSAPFALPFLTQAATQDPPGSLLTQGQVGAAAGGQPVEAGSGGMTCGAAGQQALAPDPGLEAAVGPDLHGAQPPAAAGATAAAAVRAEQAGSLADCEQQLGHRPSEELGLPAADIPGHPGCRGGTPALRSSDMAVKLLPAGAIQASKGIQDTIEGRCPAAPSRPASEWRLADAGEEVQLALLAPGSQAELGGARAAADELHRAMAAEVEEFADAEEELVGDALLAEEDNYGGMGSGHLARVPLTQAPSPSWGFDLGSPGVQRPAQQGDASFFLGSQIDFAAEGQPSMPLPMQHKEQQDWGAAHCPDSQRRPLQVLQPERQGQAQTQEPSSDPNQQGVSMACSEASTQQGSVSGMSVDEGPEEIADGKGRRRSSPWLTPLGKLAHIFKRKAEAMEGAAGRTAPAAMLAKQQGKAPPADQLQQQGQHILSPGALASCLLGTQEEPQQQEQQQQNDGHAQLALHSLSAGSPLASRGAGADARTAAASPVAPSPSASAWNAPPSPVLDKLEVEPSFELQAFDAWEEQEQDTPLEKQGSLTEDDLRRAAERAQNTSDGNMACTNTTPPVLGNMPGAEGVYAGPSSAALECDVFVSAVAAAAGPLWPPAAPVAPAAAAAPAAVPALAAPVVAVEAAATPAEAPMGVELATDGPVSCYSDPLVPSGGSTALPRTRSGFLALLQELCPLKSDSGRVPEGPHLPATAATCDSSPEVPQKVAEAVQPSEEPTEGRPAKHGPEKPLPLEKQAMGLEGAGCAQADEAHPCSPRAEGSQVYEQPRQDLEQEPASVPVKPQEAEGKHGTGELAGTGQAPSSALQPSNGAMLAMAPAQLEEDTVRIHTSASAEEPTNSVKTAPQPVAADGSTQAGVTDETHLATAPVLHPPLLAQSEALPQLGSEEGLLPTLTPPGGFWQPVEESEQHVPPIPVSEPGHAMAEGYAGPLADAAAAGEAAEEADRALAASLAAAAVQAVLAAAVAAVSEEQAARQDPGAAVSPNSPTGAAVSPTSPTGAPMAHAPDSRPEPADAPAGCWGPSFSFPALIAGQGASSPTGGMATARQADRHAAQELAPRAAADPPPLSHCSMDWSPSSGPSSSPGRIKRFLEEISDKDDLATLLHKSKRASTRPAARPSLPLLAAALQDASGRAPLRERDVPGWLEAGAYESRPHQQQQQREEPQARQQGGQHSQQPSSGSKQRRNLPGRPRRKGQAPVHLPFAAQATGSPQGGGLACAAANMAGVAPGGDVGPAASALAMQDQDVATEGVQTYGPVEADTLADEQPKGRPPVVAALDKPPILPSAATAAEQDAQKACKPEEAGIGQAAAPCCLQLSSGVQAAPRQSAAEVQAVAPQRSAETQAAPLQRSMEVQAVQPRRSAEVQTVPQHRCMGVQAVAERASMRSMGVQTSPVRRLVISTGTQTEWELVSRAVQVTPETEAVGVHARPLLLGREAQAGSGGSAAGKAGPSPIILLGPVNPQQSVPLRIRTTETKHQQQQPREEKGGGEATAALRAQGQPAKVAEAGRAAAEAKAHTEPMPKAVLEPKQEGWKRRHATKAGMGAAAVAAAEAAAKPTQERIRLAGPDARPELTAGTAAKCGNARAEEVPARSNDRHQQAGKGLPQYPHQQPLHRPPAQQHKLQTLQPGAQAQPMQITVQLPPAKLSALSEVKGVAAPAAKSKRLKTASGFAGPPKQERTRDANLGFQPQARQPETTPETSNKMQQHGQQQRAEGRNAAAPQRPSLPSAAQPPAKQGRGLAGQAAEAEAQAASVRPLRQPATIQAQPLKQATPAHAPKGLARAAVMAAAKPELGLHKVLGKRKAAGAQLGRGAAVAAAHQARQAHDTVPASRSSNPPPRVRAAARPGMQIAEAMEEPAAVAPADLYHRQHGAARQQLPSVAAGGGLQAAASEPLATDPMELSWSSVQLEKEAWAPPSHQQQQYQGYEQCPQRQHAQQGLAPAGTRQLPPARACSTPPTRRSGDYNAGAAEAELPAWKRVHPAGNSTWQCRTTLPSSGGHPAQQAEQGCLRQRSLSPPGPTEQARQPSRYNQPPVEVPGTGYGRAASPWQDSPYGQHQRPQAVGYSHHLQYTHPRATSKLQLAAAPMRAAYGAQQQQPQLMDLVMRMMQGRRK
ncbi:hypothetical protein N2152v2_004908 [Parachlorella kessleri]